MNMSRPSPVLTSPALSDPELFRQACFIDGTWQPSEDGRTIEVVNPATGQAIGHVPNMSDQAVARAIEAASRAWPAWRRLPAHERSALLRRWAGLIVQHQNDLARLMTLECGKPLAESRGEVVYAASFIEWFAEEGRRVYGDVIPAHQTDRRIVVLKQPIGVSAAITPWNFPAAMIARKVGPALAAGCSMVVKPAGQTPFSALAMAELSVRAGIPPGVFNIVTGDASRVGRVLSEHPLVRKLSFTGSTAVGKLLLAQAAGTVKKVSMELGGNAPFIVFDDADVDAAVEGAMASKYRNAGQTCVCANRVLVQGRLHDVFAERFAARVAALKVGDGLEDGVQVGPLIDADAVAKVEEHVADAVGKGAAVMTGGRRHALGGSFFEPTVLSGVTPAMRVAREETFGPVAPIFRFDTEDEAVALANDTEFGLAAYFYARDVSRVWRVAEALEYGIVGINTGIISTAIAPFGGVKESGIGREGSRYGIDEYVEIKYLCVAI